MPRPEILSTLIGRRISPARVIMIATKKIIYIVREDRIRVLMHKESRIAILLILGTYEKYTFYIWIKAISF
jgi:hypothetical protein